jgi:hypothetical protein
MKFGEWLYGEFIKWRGKTTKSKSEFADWLGLKQTIVNRYMLYPDMLPSVETIRTIEQKLPGVHSVLFTRDISESVSEIVRQAIQEALSDCEAHNISPTSEAGKAIISSVLSRYGIKSSS